MRRLGYRATTFSIGAMIGLLALSDAWAAEKHKIYLSMSYIGNDWQAESANMVKAMAASAAFKDRVDLEVQVAGANAQKQIQQINAMVQAGAKAILVFPISPTALNPVVKAACAKGVQIFAYESIITEPCAHIVSIDNKEYGRSMAKWIAEELKGKGNLVYISGVPGVSADTERTEGMNEVFAKYPGIKIIAQSPGMWSETVTKGEITKILVSHKLEEIDGFIAQIGCFSINEAQLEAGTPEDKLKPCSGEAGNGLLVQMLPRGTEAVGATGNYRPLGARAFSTWAAVSTAGYTLKLAVQALEGKQIPHNTVVTPLNITNTNVRLCQTGSWQELKDGCNTFLPKTVASPGFAPSVFNAETPELGLNAALTGQPEE